MEVVKTGNKIFVKRDYDFDLNCFTLTYTIEVYDMYEVEYKDDRGSYYKTEHVTVDEFTMTDEDIDRDYNGIMSDMWKDIRTEYNIA